MQSGARRTNFVADAAPHFSAKEKQSMERLTDHMQSNLWYFAALALVLRGTASRD
jgi:hypothetical protein